MTLKLSYKAMFRKIITILLLSAGAYHASAEIRLPEIIGDGMVLQQQTSVNIWGLASGYATVSISASWNDCTYTTKCDADGHWLTKIDTPAGGMAPQSITISEIPAGAGLSMEKACSSVTVRNILIGEVWFCSGQSNMEMPLDGFWDCPVEGSAEEIALSGKMEGIRMATIPKTGFSEPQESVSGKWMVSSPENTRWFSATAYHFAKMLHSVLGVPVGIINCSWGGSTVEGWLPQEILSGYEDISFRMQTLEDGSWDASTPMIMFNGMLHPLRHYTIKGFCWYQGESNVGRHETYSDRLQTMVSTWRDLWGQGDLPFYIVEIAPYLYGGDGTAGARLREAQFRASKAISNSGIVCTNDLVYQYENTQIHPCRKEKVGQRLAYLALNRSYGVASIDCEGPVFREMRIEDGEAFLYFDNDRAGFSPWNGIEGFEIAGEDKVFHPASASVLPGQKCLKVSSADVKAPVAVRYCFKDFCPGNLTGARNLPAYPFRTDDW